MKRDDEDNKVQNMHNAPSIDVTVEKRYNVALTLKGIRASSPSEAAGFFAEAIMQWENTTFPPVTVEGPHGSSEHNINIED